MGKENTQLADVTGPARMLLIDDDEAICTMLHKYLTYQGHEVAVGHHADDVDTALNTPIDVVLLDFNLPGKNGFEILDRLQWERPDLAVVMLTAMTAVESIVEAMRRGAYDYVTKPLDLQRLSVVVRNASAHTRLKQESDGLRAAILRDDGGPDLLCASSAMTDVISLVERVAATRVPVLVHGESGTGKELVARRIHARGAKKRPGPFVAINCTALPADTMERELFGDPASEETPSAPSKLDQARNGTLFLDEVGELSLELQQRLLRVLQDAQRDGGAAAETRLIATTNRHLATEVSRGAFCADLFYRLNVFSIIVPPLRDRREDIPALARYALARFAIREGKPPSQISDDALAVLLGYDWPGNVRELNNVLERAALLSSEGIIHPYDLPKDLRLRRNMVQPSPSPLPLLGSLSSSISETQIVPLHELERNAMVAALRETRGNVSEAARRLGIGRATFYRRAQRHGLTREDGFPG